MVRYQHNFPTEATINVRPGTKKSGPCKRHIKLEPGDKCLGCQVTKGDGSCQTCRYLMEGDCGDCLWRKNEKKKAN